MCYFALMGDFIVVWGMKNNDFHVPDWYMDSGKRTLHQYSYSSMGFPMGEDMSLHEGADIG